MVPLLTFEKKLVYGKERLYPTCVDGKALCDLVGGKTLARHHLGYILRLGSKVQLVGDKRELVSIENYTDYSFS